MQNQPQPKGITMSNDKKNVNVSAVPSEPTLDNTENAEEKRPNFAVRSFRAIKANPKNTLAVVAGTALVAGAAFLGRSTAPMHLQIVESDFEPEPLIETPTSDDQSA